MRTTCNGNRSRFECRSRTTHLLQTLSTSGLCVMSSIIQNSLICHDAAVRAHSPRHRAGSVQYSVVGWLVLTIGIAISVSFFSKGPSSQTRVDANASNEAAGTISELEDSELGFSPGFFIASQSSQHSATSSGSVAGQSHPSGRSVVVQTAFGANAMDQDCPLDSRRLSQPLAIAASEPDGGTRLSKPQPTDLSENMVVLGERRTADGLPGVKAASSADLFGRRVVQSFDNGETIVWPHEDYVVPRSFESSREDPQLALVEQGPTRNVAPNRLGRMVASPLPRHTQPNWEREVPGSQSVGEDFEPLGSTGQHAADFGFQSRSQYSRRFRVQTEPTPGSLIRQPAR
jgi:hypothetical protein